MTADRRLATAAALLQAVDPAMAKAAAVGLIAFSQAMPGEQAEAVKPFLQVLARAVSAPVRSDLSPGGTRRQAGPVLVTTAVAAAEAGLSERTLRRHFTPHGTLPVVRIGRSVRIDRDDLDAWLARHRTSIRENI